MSKDQYTKLFESIVNHEPVAFKEIFETIMKDKATEYVNAFKEELHKEIFNITEDGGKGSDVSDSDSETDDRQTNSGAAPDSEDEEKTGKEEEDI
jgi:hypothetical protein